jgi:hypothetical protein
VRPRGAERLPDRSPPRRPDEMSLVEVREEPRDSPERARSLLTVRAAISSALPVLAPRSSWLSLTCSYWRPRFVPGLTPRGGIAPPPAFRESFDPSLPGAWGRKRVSAATPGFAPKGGGGRRFCLRLSSHSPTQTGTCNWTPAIDAICGGRERALREVRAKGSQAAKRSHAGAAVADVGRAAVPFRDVWSAAVPRASRASRC